VRKDYPPGILAIQDTGLLRAMRLHHQIERCPVQLSPEEAGKLLAAAPEKRGQAAS
jgi:hypothetical protein